MEPSLLLSGECKLDVSISKEHAKINLSIDINGLKHRQWGVGDQLKLIETFQLAHYETF